MNEKFLEYNRRGLIPGPRESEGEFLKRVSYCQDLNATVYSIAGQETSHEDAKASLELIQEAAPVTKKLFDIVPDWAPIVFSNDKMSFWHGGSAWIFQLNDESPTAAFFQLRKAFKTSKTYLGLYSRNEILAHESAHIGRMLFEEPKFEELLAYRTSPSAFRRFFGSIVQSHWESLFFVFTLFLCFLSDLLIVATGYSDPNHSSLWIKTIPALLIVFGVARVCWRQYQFQECLKKLNEFLEPETANAVIYRLQDKEIIAFKDMSEIEIRRYAISESGESLRWRLICDAYLGLDC